MLQQFPASIACFKCSESAFMTAHVVVVQACC
jgi:hypothetical protein